MYTFFNNKNNNNKIIIIIRQVIPHTFAKAAKMRM